jgi:type I secretion membrane fusion protein, HlyD family
MENSDDKGLLLWLTGRCCPSAAPLDFAPDLLRIQRMPPRPLPRAVLLGGLALFTIALVWAALGQLDVVAVAQGKLVPRNYLKIVQPPEAGIVREILVSEGETVQAGQVLMRMDSTVAEAEMRRLDGDFRQAQIALRRIDAELDDTPFDPADDDPPELFREALALYEADRTALQAALAEERAAWERAGQDLAAAQEVEKKLREILPLVREQDATYQKLAAQGYVGRLAASEKARERIEKEKELKTQAYLIARERAVMSQSERRMEQIRSDYLKRLRDERTEVALQVARLEQELAKQGHRQSLLELKASHNGVVKSLATHTVGTVTQPGTILMTLVPEGEPLLAEVMLSNEDVGFIRQGQEVKLKFAAFRFQKYGMLDGVVHYVAADAEEQQEPVRGLPTADLVYRSLVALEAQALTADGISHVLVPGMQVTAEIKLGTRSVLEYLLSPVHDVFHEAGRER